MTEVAKQKKTGGKVIAWAVILTLSIGIAYGLAHWWAIRAEKQALARIAKAPLAELESLSKTRDWDPQVFHWLGKRLSDAGRYPEAQSAFARAAALEPNAFRLTELGLALARNDRPQEAELQMKEALKKDPQLAYVHFALGNLYGRYKRWDQAAPALKRTTELDPKNREARYLLALCYGEMFMSDRKMELLEALVKEDPDNIRYLKSLGYSYLFFSKFAQAEAAYRHILKLDPNDQEGRYLLGRALAEQASSPADLDEAEKLLQQVSLQAPNQPGVPVALGILYARRNQPAKAVTELEKAIRLGSTEHKTLLYLGQAYMRVGRQEEGRKALAKFEKDTAVTRNVSQLENRLLNTPDDEAHRGERIEIQLRLVRVFIGAESYQRALNVLSDILDRAPNHPEAQKLVQECRTAQKGSRQ